MSHLRCALLLTSLALEASACATTATTPIEQPTEQPTPPCQIGMAHDGALSLDNAPTGLQAPLETSLRTWSLGPGEALAAPRYVWESPLSSRAQPSGLLWRATCKPGGPSTLEVLVHRPGADFSSAALDPDAPQQRLFFTDTTGASVLDLTTREISIVTLAPDVPRDCWTWDAATPRPTTDRVLDLQGGTLNLHRGARCGFEGAWRAAELRFSRRSPTTVDPTPRQPRPVASVTAAPDGRLWLGDAGRCDEPGAVDLQTEGAVWVSDNGGASWHARSVQAPGHPMITAAAQIISFPDRPGVLLLRSQLCRTDMIGGGRDLYRVEENGRVGGDRAVSRGGSLYRTDDNGASWRALTVPVQIASPKASSHQLRYLQAASPEQLIIWGDNGRVFATGDGGATWVSAIAPHPPPLPPEAASPLPVQLQGKVFTPTADGLLLSSPELPSLRIFPELPQLEE